MKLNKNYTIQSRTTGINKIINLFKKENDRCKIKIISRLDTVPIYTKISKEQIEIEPDITPEQIGSKKEYTLFIATSKQDFYIISEVKPSQYKRLNKYYQLNLKHHVADKEIYNLTEQVIGDG